MVPWVADTQLTKERRPESPRARPAGPLLSLRTGDGARAQTARPLAVGTHARGGRVSSETRWLCCGARGEAEVGLVRWLEAAMCQGRQPHRSSASWASAPGSRYWTGGLGTAPFSSTSRGIALWGEEQKNPGRMAWFRGFGEVADSRLPLPYKGPHLFLADLSHGGGAVYGAGAGLRPGHPASPHSGLGSELGRGGGREGSPRASEGGEPGVKEEGEGGAWRKRRYHVNFTSWEAGTNMEAP